MNCEIAILGIKMDLGHCNRGADFGPESIRQAGLIKRLEHNGLNIKDYGDVNTKTSELLNQNDQTYLDINDIAQEFIKLNHYVRKLCINAKFPLILGGDHSISIATIAGISSFYKNLGVIWFDAHADVNTPETSISGSIYGMPLAVNLGYGYPLFRKVGYDAPKVKSENVVLVGTRELDPGEYEFLKDHGIKVYSMNDIFRMGIEQVITEVLYHLGKKCDGVHLSFDMDVLDPFYAPGVRTPCKKGITLSDTILAMQTMARSRLITSVEFVEVNPNLDIDHRTARNLVKLAESLLIINNV